MGLSGKTEFPHVYLSVRYQDPLVDPFLSARRTWAETSKTGCYGKPNLLADTFAYQPTGVLSSGFTDQVPSQKPGRFGLTLAQTPRPSNLVFWVMMFSIQPRDEALLRIIAPDGHALAHKESQTSKKYKSRVVHA